VKRTQSWTFDPASTVAGLHKFGMDSENVNPASNNQEFYDGMAHEYDQTYHLMSKYRELCTKVETDFVLSKMVAHGRTLEVGPGQGRFTQRLAENSHTVVAADISRKMLEICQTRTKARNVVYHHLDLFELDERKVGGMFDTIVAMWVIPHLENGTVAMQKLLSLLKPDGRMIFDLWNSSSLRKSDIVRFNHRKLHEAGHWIHERGWVYTHYYSYEEMLTLIRGVGLRARHELGWCLIPMMNYRGSRLLLPFYKLIDRIFQMPCKKYYYSRLFCCSRN
jgi:2-polyprenyl-3-methyl-5-hydroxy-6-metoxy-1,4-benzoquinol methylase